MRDAWIKRGLLFCPTGEHPCMRSHAANPVATRMTGSLYRVYYSTRDRLNRSSVGAVDIDLDNMEVLKPHINPLFQYGPPNSFYSHGVSLGNSFVVDDQQYLTFMGWHFYENDLWRGEVGCLKIEADFSLTLHSNKPMLGIDQEDPVSLSYPYVLYHRGKYRMWYGSTVDWEAGNGEMHHVIKYAESNDGVKWIKFGQAVPSKIGVAQAFSRPCVLTHQNKLTMWFGYRTGNGEKYKIGFSESVDGRNWSFPEDALTPSASGWDSEMVEYPYVLNRGNRRLMIYNGNGFGSTGFGWAESKNA